jgi:FAD/FMN-containing dehydrogenase
MESSAAAMDAALELDAAFQGQQFRPGDDGYDDARAIYNGMVDKRPALVARCSGVADVIEAVNLAREKGLPLAVRCGGHNVAGKAVCDEGIVIDLRGMKGVHVDRNRRTARVNGGVTWGEFDRETQLFGLTTPGGRMTGTGVGGFTLGGGYAWTSTVHGLACDNLISAEVVTADGRVVTASEDENADLLWGLRGGGGNFGVVTSYEFRLHDLGPMIYGGMVVHPIDAATDVARAWRDWIESAPDEVCAALGILLAPPEPFVPLEVQGTPVMGILAMYCGTADEGEEALRPLKTEIGPPAVDLLDRIPYTAFQAIVDPFSPTGWLNYHRGEHLAGLPDEAIEAYVRNGRKVTTPMGQTILFRTGGAIARVPDDATAASHRDAPYMWHPIAAWSDPADTDAQIAWVRESSEAMRPFATGGVYLNFEQDEGAEHVRAGFSPEKYARLVELKDKYDPGNLFRVNQNIAPSGAAR